MYHQNIQKSFHSSQLSDSTSDRAEDWSCIQLSKGTDHEMSLALLLEGIDLALELRPRKSEKDQLVTEQCYLVWLKDTGSCRDS